MPKIPRDLSGKELAKLLSRFNYEITRQTGSHIRLTTNLLELARKLCNRLFYQWNSSL